MKTNSLLGLLVAMAVCYLWSVSSASAAGKIRVLIIDGQNNHNWRATTPLMKRELEETGRFTVAVSSNLKPGDAPGEIAETVPFPPDLSRYDVIVSNYNGAAWPVSSRRRSRSGSGQGRSAW